MSLDQLDLKLIQCKQNLARDNHEKSVVSSRYSPKQGRWMFEYLRDSARKLNIRTKTRDNLKSGKRRKENRILGQD